MSLLSIVPTTSLRLRTPFRSWKKAEGYGALTAAVLAISAGVLLSAPLSSGPAIDNSVHTASLDVSHANANAFIDQAPFDALHRRETSIGSLQKQLGATPAPPDPFIISGILINGDERKVMFSSDPDHWIGEGTEVNGWLVRYIEPENVTLTRGADIKALTYAKSLSELSDFQP
jgi:hypothetical protein